jgi:hypothetical protein
MASHVRFTDLFVLFVSFVVKSIARWQKRHGEQGGDLGCSVANQMTQRIFTTAKPKLTWYVPRWAYTRQLWSQLNRILNPAALIRITLGTAIVSAAIIAGFKWAVPQIVLPNLWPLVFALPAILLLLVLQFGVLTLIPPTATICSDRIIVQHGQSATIIDSKTVTASFLTFHTEGRIRLRICYTRKSERKSRVIGVPPTVDFNRLSEMLPVAPVVRDARNRSHMQHSP